MRTRFMMRAGYVVFAACALVVETSLAAAQQAARPPLREATAEMNGIKLHYRITGSGPPLLLLHGFSGAGAWWNPLVEDLSEEHTLIIPDLPGHGRSGARSGSYRFDDVARDLYALMDELGFDRFRAVGYSGGGITLIHMLTEEANRIEAAALLSTPHILSTELILAFPSFENHPAQVQEYWALVHPGGEAQVRRLISSFHGLAEEGEEVNFAAEQLSTIKARTLVVVGDRDPVVPMERALELYRAIPTAALWVVPGEEHSPVMPNWGGSPEARRIFPNIIHAFLGKSEAPSGTPE